MIDNTFFMDFSIAGKFGKNAIKDTYKRAFAGWKDNYKYMTALVMTLNHKIWQHYEEGNQVYTELYDELWRKCDTWCMDNLTGEELNYYIRELD